MVRINLLPIRASKKRELGKQWLVLFALVAVASFVGNYFWYSRTDSKLTEVKTRITQYEQDVATLNKIIGEVKNIKQQKAEIEQKLNVLKQLRTGRTGPVRILDELVNVLPPKTWLATVDEGGGGITFTGAAISHEEVANFIKKLKASKFFSNPQLKTTKQTGENKVEFVLSCTVKYGA